MRMIGKLESATNATRFGDFLYVNGIENNVDEEDDGTFSVWVHDDEYIQRASDLLARFRSDPSAREFDSATKATDKRREEEKAERRRRSVVADSARVGYERNFMGTAYVPAVLMIICIGVYIITEFNPLGWRRTPWLLISEYRIVWGTEFFLREVREGQVWRLITPIFLHGGILHIVFNMMWLRDLGSFIENRFGAGYLAGLILASAILSNVGQALWGSPDFGGMSGVNYALFGFLWMRGRFDRTSAWALHPHIVYTMIGWFIVCYTGLFGNIANTAHAVGLAVGALWGYLSSGHFRWGK